MKKFTLLLFAMLACTWLSFAQTLNQSASWPNASWTLSGTYTPVGLLSDPTGAGTTFTWDDDAAGGASTGDELFATSPVIDLTAANGAGETLLTISGDYVYRALGGDVLTIEVYDADATTWSVVETFAGNSGNADYQTCAGTVAYTTAEIDISGYTATQLSGFQYRISYFDANGWQWGWCLTSPTITSAAPPSCPDPTTLTAANITDTAADLGWTESGTATVWDIEIVDITAAGAFTGTPTAAGVTTNPYGATGLSSGNNYEFYVRADCGGAGSSAWVGPFAFTTLPSCGDTIYDTGGPGANYSNGENYTITYLPDAPGNLVTLDFTLVDLETCCDNLGVYDGLDTAATAFDTDLIAPATFTATNPAGAITIEFTSDGSVTDIGWEANYTCAAPPACLDPTTLTTANITDTTADLGWTENGTATVWDIEIVDITAAGAFTGTPTAAGVTTNPYGATGLTAQNDYEFYVRADCGVDGTSAWVGPFAFTTACATETAPYSEDFENAGAVPDCWTNDGAEAWLFNTSGPNHVGNGGTLSGSTLSGSYYAVIDDSSPDPGNQLTSPFVDLTPLTTPTLSFYLISDNEGFTNSTLTVEVWDGAAWNIAGSYTGNTAGWEEQSIDLSIYTFTGPAQARFSVADSGDFYDDIAIDDVSFDNPPACPNVSAIVVSNVTETTADVDWTVGGSETNWEVAVQTAGTGIPGAATDTSGTNSYSATGLTSNTAYEVYVRSDCGGGDFGDWIGATNFTTLPSCGDTVYDTGGPGGNYSNGESYTITYSPDAPGNVVTLDFTSVSIESGFDFLSVYDGVGTGGTAFTTDLQAPATFTATDPSGALTIEFTSDGSVNQAGWEANYTCAAPATCFAVSGIAVSNVTDTSADIAWTNAGSETNWEVAVQTAGTGEPGAADGSGTDTAANPYTASSLSSGVAYEVYVRAECTAGVDFGPWVGPVDFTTTVPVVSSFPYTEDFDASAGGWAADNTVNGTWELGAPANTIINSADSGTDAWVTNLTGSYNNNEDSFVTSPEFDMTTLTNPAIALSIWYNSEFSWDGMVLQSSIDGGTSWQNVGALADPNNWYNDGTIAGAPGGQQTGWSGRNSTANGSGGWLVASNTLTGLAGQSSVILRVAFGSDGSVNDEGVAFDTVIIYEDVPTTFTYTSGTWAPFDPMGVSDFDDDLIIAAGDYVMDGDMTINAMFVDPGASVTVDTGVTLNNVGPLVLQSTSTSYSSLIRNGDVLGIMLYQRHVNINAASGTTTGSNDLVSAPVTGQTFDLFAGNNPNILNNGTNFLFGPFEKNTGQFVNWAATETSTLDAGVGYRTGTTNNSFVTFQGAAENGVVTNAIVNQGTNNEEWNLIGNPYPSYLNVQDFLNHDVGGGTTNIQLFDGPTAAIYGYDGSALNGWTVYNLATTTPSTLIAPGQGFFVSADAGSTGAFDVEFTPAMRSAGSSDDFIVGRNPELTYVSLAINAGDKSYNTDFYFNINATQGFDFGYDANIWGDSAPDFALYSHLVQDNVGDAVTLQALSMNELNDVTIPLGVNANQGEQLTFSIADMNIPASVNVYLEDVVANTVTLLNATDYVITPTSDLSGTGRFFLSTSNESLSTIDNSLDTLNIFALKASQELVVSGQLFDENTMLTLYDMQGRLVLNTELDNASLQNRIDVSNINAGVYIVTVQSNEQEKTKKVIIN